MDKRLKEGIKRAYRAPEPDRAERARFLAQLPPPKITMRQFILMQATYLRKTTIFGSLLLFLPALGLAQGAQKDSLWAMCSLVPFLALLAVSESARSAVWGMSEFEMSTRFSLKTVVLARMGALAVLDGVILLALALLWGRDGFSLFQTGVYLIVPYLLTVTVNLGIARRIHGKEAIYSCMGATALISGAGAIVHFTADFVYGLTYFHRWGILSLFLAAAMAGEIYNTIKQTEELTWSL